MRTSVTNVTVCLLALLTTACGEAKEKVEQARKKAEEVKAQVDEKKGVVTAKVFDATMVALRVKGELEKVYNSASDHDVVVSSENADDAAMKAHEAAIAAMPHVTIGDLTVGYEEDQNRSLKGTAFARHFRATWAWKGKKIGVSYYTKQEIDAQAFAKILEKMVPLVQASLG